MAERRISKGSNAAEFIAESGLPSEAPVKEKADFVVADFPLFLDRGHASSRSALAARIMDDLNAL
jgi:hypothetical protein